MQTVHFVMSEPVPYHIGIPNRPEDCQYNQRTPGFEPMLHAYVPWIVLSRRPMYLMPEQPLKALGAMKVCHMQGVTSLSWCRHEPSYLLSSSKDGKIMLWNASQGTFLGSFTAGPPGEYAHEVMWSPYHPGLFAVATLGGPEGQNKVGMLQASAHSFPSYLFMRGRT